MAWSILWVLFVSDDPHERFGARAVIRTHPYEAYIIEKDREESTSGNDDKGKIPWKMIFTSRGVWALIVNDFSSTFHSHPHPLIQIDLIPVMNDFSSTFHALKIDFLVVVS